MSRSTSRIGRSRGSPYTRCASAAPFRTRKGTLACAIAQATSATTRGPYGRRVRVLCPPRPEASAEVGGNRQTGPLDMREHERLHAVLFRSDRELVE